MFSLKSVIATTKHTFGFKRLFWRIFLAFWLTSILTVVATGFVIINETSSSEFHNRFVNNLTVQAERIIWRYENDAKFNPRNLAELFDKWKNKRDKFAERLMPMGIVDENNQLVYRYKVRRDKLEKLLNFTLAGPSNKSYQVYTPPPEAPKMIKQVFYRFQSLQFVFIFIASAIVSALLSWTIVKPLNQLGAYSRRYAEEQKPSELPPPLLKRGDEVGDLAVDIEFMVKKTHHSANAQQQLLYDVSHELRAPLARLQVSAALIEQKMPDNRHALQINNDCVRIDQLIQKILNYSKLNQDNQLRESCELIELCQSVIGNMAVQYPLIAIQFETTLIEANFCGYKESLNQALDNIMGNACKYSFEKQKVEIKLQQISQEFVITVRDHGLGVDDAEIEQLMQPFYRAGNQMHTQGFGLGLSIALRAINKHQGQLTLANHPEGGLLVTIFLPSVNPS